jgi:hypothetical protein
MVTATVFPADKIYKIAGKSACEKIVTATDLRNGGCHRFFVAKNGTA